MTDDDDKELDANGRASALLEETRCAARDAGAFYTWAGAAWEAFRCEWDGLSLDGRTYGREGSRERPVAAFPWAGAPDSRVRLAERAVREKLLFRATAVRRGVLQGEPVEIRDTAAAGVMRAAVSHLVKVEMRGEVPRESARWAATTLWLGHGVLAVDWQDDRTASPSVVDRAQVLQLLATVVPPPVEGAPLDEADVEAAFLEEQYAAQALDAVRSVALATALGDGGSVQPDRLPELKEDVSESGAREALDLLQKGEASAEVMVAVDAGRPRWRALVPFVDVFYPVDTADLADAPWVAEVRWFSKTEFSSTAGAEEWDKAWVRDVKEKPGRSLSSEWAGGSSGRVAGGFPGWALGGIGVGSQMSEEAVEGYFQLLQVTYWDTVADLGGARVLRRTLLHPDVEGAAYDEPDGSWHGRMPYVSDRREPEVGALVESRGIPELVVDLQVEKKIYRDAEGAATQLHALPPVSSPVALLKNAQSDIRPMGVVPRLAGRNGSLEFMPLPGNAGNAARRSTETVDEQVDRLLMLVSPAVDPTVWQASIEEDTAHCLEKLGEAMAMTAALYLGHSGKEELEQIGGAPLAALPTRREVQRELHVRWGFDGRDLTNEFVALRIKLLEQMVALDAGATVDVAKAVPMLLAALDPAMAAAVVRSPQSASRAESADEMNKLAQILMGLAPEMNEMGEDHATRLGVLEEQFQTNPVVKRRMGEDPQVQEILQARVKHHQFQVQQRENAQTGRVGAEAVV